MRAIKFLFNIVLLIALVAGGAYGYYWYQVKTFVDQKIVELSPFAQVTYDQLIVDPRGEIRLEKLTFTPRDIPTSIPIRSIGFKSSDPMFFFDPAGRADRGEWPSFLALSVNQLTVDINNNLVPTSAIPEGDVDYQAVDLNALACGDVSRFTPSVMQEMGIRSTDINIVLSADIDNALGGLEMTLDFDMSGIGQVQASVDLAYAAGYLKSGTAMAANPRLTYLSSVYQDLGFYSKRDTYCSEKTGVAPEEYRQLHVDAVADYLKRIGMTVPPVLMQAYQDGTDKGSRFEVTMRPIGGLGTEVIMGLGAPDEIIDRLGLKLLVNTRPVDISNVDWTAMVPNPDHMLSEIQSAPQVDSESVAVVETMAEPDDSDTQVAVPEESVVATEDESALASRRRFLGIPEKEEVIEKSFQSTNFSELTSYIDSDIRVYTYFGNKVEGRLQSVEGNSLKILQRLDMGLAIYPIDRDKLQTIQVYR